MPEVTDTYWDWLKTDKNMPLTLNERSRHLNRYRPEYWPQLNSIKIEIVLDAFIGVWSKFNSPHHKEKTIDFLTKIIQGIANDNPDTSLPTLARLLQDQRYTDLHPDIKSIRASQIRKKALMGFTAPSSKQVVAILEQGEIATVEGLRALLIEEFQLYQADLDGSETTHRDIFYKNYETGVHLGEVGATLRITDRLRLRLEHKGITVTPEHQLNDSKRCDFTCTKILDNQRKFLVIEVKGQWHKDLYSAASERLYKLYAKHPDAEQQGIYLVLWFGSDEKVANKSTHNINSALELKESIEAKIQVKLKGFIDVFVLDVSKD
ncbi:MAG: hypothetical protein COA42_09985 [Alteromonadaceae bacterium]|nr:MAG: hypothetical protein COA42_09985 [Alteromonadaceae bacterium]